MNFSKVYSIGLKTWWSSMMFSTLLILLITLKFVNARDSVTKEIIDILKSESTQHIRTNIILIGFSSNNTISESISNAYPMPTTLVLLNSRNTSKLLSVIPFKPSVYIILGNTNQKKILDNPSVQRAFKNVYGNLFLVIMNGKSKSLKSRWTWKRMLPGKVIFVGAADGKQKSYHGQGSSRRKRVKRSWSDESNGQKSKVKLSMPYLAYSLQNLRFMLSGLSRILDLELSHGRSRLNSIFVYDPSEYLHKHFHIEISRNDLMEDYITFVTRPIEDNPQFRDNKREMALRFYARPLESQVWLAISVTFAITFCFFTLVAICFPRKRRIYWSPMSYTGRKLLEVLNVMRWAYRRDCSVGKGGSLVYKTGLALVFIPYIQLLMKNSRELQFYHHHHFLMPYLGEMLWADSTANENELDQGSLQGAASKYQFVAATEDILFNIIQFGNPWFGRKLRLLQQDNKLALATRATPPCHRWESRCPEGSRNPRQVWFDWNSNLQRESKGYDFKYGYKVSREELYKTGFKLAAPAECLECVMIIRKFDALFEGGLMEKIRAASIFNPRGPSYLQWGLGERVYYPMPRAIYSVAVFFDLLGCGLTIATGCFILEKIIRKRKCAVWAHMFPLREVLVGTLTLSLGSLFLDFWPATTWILNVAEIGAGILTFLGLLIRHFAQRSISKSRCAEIVDKIAWTVLTLGWYGIVIIYWILGNDLYTFRAVPALLVCLFTPL